MKNIALYVLLIFLAVPVYAQIDQKTSYDKEKLESAKVAFITQRIDLTPDQAEKFWPLYNQHHEKKSNLIKDMHELLKIGDREISNEEAMELIDQKFELEQEILDMDKAFFLNIVKVITPVQALKLGDVNRAFTRHIYHMQKKKRGNNS
jgi:Spy/CpxP family protein refolding chaperone